MMAGIFAVNPELPSRYYKMNLAAKERNLYILYAFLFIFQTTLNAILFGIFCCVAASMDRGSFNGPPRPGPAVPRLSLSPSDSSRRAATPAHTVVPSVFARPEDDALVQHLTAASVADTSNSRHPLASAGVPSRTPNSVPAPLSAVTPARRNPDHAPQLPRQAGRHPPRPAAVPASASTVNVDSLGLHLSRNNSESFSVINNHSGAFAVCGEAGDAAEDDVTPQQHKRPRLAAPPLLQRLPAQHPLPARAHAPQASNVHVQTTTLLPQQQHRAATPDSAVTPVAVTPGIVNTPVAPSRLATREATLLPVRKSRASQLASATGSSAAGNSLGEPVQGSTNNIYSSHFDDISDGYDGGIDYASIALAASNVSSAHTSISTRTESANINHMNNRHMFMTPVDTSSGTTAPHKQHVANRHSTAVNVVVSDIDDEYEYYDSNTHAAGGRNNITGKNAQHQNVRAYGGARAARAPPPMPSISPLPPNVNNTGVGMNNSNTQTENAYLPTTNPVNTGSSVSQGVHASGSEYSPFYQTPSAPVQHQHYNKLQPQRRHMPQHGINNSDSTSDMATPGSATSGSVARCAKTSTPSVGKHTHASVQHGHLQHQHQPLQQQQRRKPPVAPVPALSPALPVAKQIGLVSSSAGSVGADAAGALDDPLTMAMAAIKNFPVADSGARDAAQAQNRNRAPKSKTMKHGNIASESDNAYDQHADNPDFNENINDVDDGHLQQQHQQYDARASDAAATNSDNIGWGNNTLTGVSDDDGISVLSLPRLMASFCSVTMTPLLPLTHSITVTARNNIGNTSNRDPSAALGASTAISDAGSSAVSDRGNLASTGRGGHEHLLTLNNEDLDSAVLSFAPPSGPQIQPYRRTTSKTNTFATVFSNAVVGAIAATWANMSTRADDAVPVSLADRARAAANVSILNNMLCESVTPVPFISALPPIPNGLTYHASLMPTVIPPPVPVTAMRRRHLREPALVPLHSDMTRDGSDIDNNSGSGRDTGVGALALGGRLWASSANPILFLTTAINNHMNNHTLWTEIVNGHSAGSRNNNGVKQARLMQHLATCDRTTRSQDLAALVVALLSPLTSPSHAHVHGGSNGTARNSDTNSGRPETSSVSTPCHTAIVDYLSGRARLVRASALLGTTKAVTFYANSFSTTNPSNHAAQAPVLPLCGADAYGLGVLLSNLSIATTHGAHSSNYARGMKTRVTRVRDYAAAVATVHTALSAHAAQAATMTVHPSNATLSDDSQDELGSLTVAARCASLSAALPLGLPFYSRLDVVPWRTTRVTNALHLLPALAVTQTNTKACNDHDIVTRTSNRTQKSNHDNGATSSAVSDAPSCMSTVTFDPTVVIPTYVRQDIHRYAHLYPSVPTANPPLVVSAAAAAALACGAGASLATSMGANAFGSGATGTWGTAGKGAVETPSSLYKAGSDLPISVWDYVSAHSVESETWEWWAQAVTARLADSHGNKDSTLYDDLTSASVYDEYDRHNERKMADDTIGDDHNMSVARVAGAEKTNANTTPQSTADVLLSVDPLLRFADLYLTSDSVMLHNHEAEIPAQQLGSDSVSDDALLLSVLSAVLSSSATAHGFMTARTSITKSAATASTTNNNSSSGTATGNAGVAINRGKQKQRVAGQFVDAGNCDEVDGAIKSEANAKLGTKTKMGGRNLIMPVPDFTAIENHNFSAPAAVAPNARNNNNKNYNTSNSRNQVRSTVPLSAQETPYTPQSLSTPGAALSVTSAVPVAHSNAAEGAATVHAVATAATPATTVTPTTVVDSNNTRGHARATAAAAGAPPRPPRDSSIANNASNISTIVQFSTATNASRGLASQIGVTSSAATPLSGSDLRTPANPITTKSAAPIARKRALESDHDGDRGNHDGNGQNSRIQFAPAHKTNHPHAATADMSAHALANTHRNAHSDYGVDAHIHFAAGPDAGIDGYGYGAEANDDDEGDDEDDEVVSEIKWKNHSRLRRHCRECATMYVARQLQQTADDSDSVAVDKSSALYAAARDHASLVPLYRALFYQAKALLFPETGRFSGRVLLSTNAVARAVAAAFALIAPINSNNHGANNPNVNNSQDSSVNMIDNNTPCTQPQGPRVLAVPAAPKPYNNRSNIIQSTSESSLINHNNSRTRSSVHSSVHSNAQSFVHVQSRLQMQPSQLQFQQQQHPRAGQQQPGQGLSRSYSQSEPTPVTPPNQPLRTRDAHGRLVVGDQQQPQHRRDEQKQ